MRAIELSDGEADLPPAESPLREQAPGVRTFATIEEAARDWVSLDRRHSNVFSTYEWASAWWRHFGAGRSLRLMAARDQTGRVVAILPMYSERRYGVPLVRFIGTGAADQLGAVCEPGHPGELSALWAASRSNALCFAERLPSNLGAAHAIGGSRIHAEPSPVISLSRFGSWEEYLAAHSTNFRQQVRRRARRLAQGHGVRFRLPAGHRELSSDFDMLLALHRARWRGTTDAFSGRQAAFHREFAAQALERGWLRLWLAEAGGVAVAAWYGFRFAQVEYFYQSGRDPAWERLAVGAGLLEHTIRAAFEDGMTEYRLLRGGERYKFRYATSDGGVETVVAAPDRLRATSLKLVRLLSTTAVGRRVLSKMLRVLLYPPEQQATDRHRKLEDARAP
jgi:CelD/BcsL family acetyltransferase involved in cellulose biosynthesis